jgi:type II secretory pathway component PulF
MKKIFACVLIVLLVVSVIPAFARPTPKEKADLAVDAVIGISLGFIKHIGTPMAAVFTAVNYIVVVTTGKSIGGYAIDGFERSSEKSILKTIHLVDG